jgi:ABC-type phosphate transport system substrate-binding protein
MAKRARLVALVAAVLAGSAAMGAAEEYKVIVNAANPVTSMKRSDVSRLFLKQTTRWPNGTTVEPVDLSLTSPLRQRFTRDVHSKSLDAIEAYWRREMFSGHEMPPPTRLEPEIVAFVRAHPGAIGYVSATANLGADIKAVAVAEN